MDELKNPNVIIILTDDQGYNDLSIQGSQTIRTPNIDKMALGGMRFTNFHAQPVCGPSRAALMTGCYPQRIGQVGNGRVGVGGHPLIHQKEWTMAKMFKEQGYATKMIGKWHLGMSDNNDPLSMGFNEFEGTPGSNDGAWIDLNSIHFADSAHRDASSEVFPDVPFIKNKEVVEFPMNQTGITTRYTDIAVEYIEESVASNKPFFLYIAHNMPHIPLHPSLDFRGKSNHGLYGDCIEELDWNMGRIMELLSKLQADRDTLVIYTSDNGPWLRPELIEQQFCGSAYPLRGGKVTSWEGGSRVPCVMSMPGSIPEGSVSDEFVTSMDLLPTLTNMIGGTTSEGIVIDGHDIWDIMTDENGATSPYEKFYFYMNRNLQAVQLGPWKLILSRPALPELMSPYWAEHFKPVSQPELYNLNRDISECNNESENFPEIVVRLLELANEAREELGEGNSIGWGERQWEPSVH